MKALFEQALALPARQRAAFLDRACGDDPALHAELASLLEANDEASAYFGDLADAVFAPAPAPPHALSGDPLIGRRVSHYEVQEKLGGGGMGVVYKARDVRLRRPVALKFLPPELTRDPEAKQRFVHEAQAASALDHVNLCTIHEIAETGQGQLFIVMAYYAGETLKKKIERGPLPLDAALDYAIQIARGLEKAHARGIIHRDIKPANVMITEPVSAEAEHGVVKILDFGLAKMAGQQLTKTGSTLGTIAYMSPEQAQGEPVGLRTDLWSLGVVLYEMLAGERPFKGGFDQAVLYAIRHESPDPITRHRPDVPSSVAALLEGLLQKDPAHRTASAAQVIADLTRAGGRPGEDRERSRSAPTRTAWTRRALIATATLVAALLAWWGARTTAPTAREAVSDAGPRNAIAVFPFSVQGGESLAYLRQGMVTLLSTKLEGAGPLRSIDPNALLGYLDRYPDRFLDPEEGRRAAAFFEAGRYILGSVTQAGDRVLLDARLYDAQGSVETAAQATFAREGDFIPALDELARQLVSRELEASGFQLATLSSKTTPSFEALKAYLEGEQALRDGLWEPAIALARQAVDIDSTFALAWYLMGLGYASPGRVQPAREAFLRAQAHARDAPDRIRLLINAENFFNTDRPDEAERLYREVLARHPTDLHALAGLGDLLYHFNPLRGRPAAEALPYMARVRLYDEDNEHAQGHRFSELLRMRDYEAADSLVFLFGPTSISTWLHRILRGPQAARDSLYTVLEPGAGIWLLLANHFVEAREVERRIAPRAHTEEGRKRGRGVSAMASITLGQWKEALREIQGMDASAAEHFILGEVAWSLTPYALASTEDLEALERRVARPDTTRFSPFVGRGFEYPEDRDAVTRRYLAGLLQWRRGDGHALAQTAERLEADVADTEQGRRARSYHRMLKALLAWRDHRSEEALALIEQAQMMPDWVILFRSYPRSQVFNRYVRAEILYELGRYEEALRWYGALYDGFEFQGMEMLPYSYLRRAQIYEELGDSDQAIAFYTRFVELWKDCDPELRPWVDEAKQGLQRVLRSDRGI